MLCNNCGCPVDEGAKFCANCGAAVYWDFPSDTDAENNCNQTPVKRKKPGKIVAIGVAIVGVALISFSMGAFFMEMDTGSDFKSGSGAYEELESENAIEPTTEAAPSNNYGIYVIGNTELARLAGNTLIDKAACPWESDYCYGYVLKNGDYDSDGTFSSYSNVSVAVNEDPSYPYTGTIVIQATRTTNGQQYSLRVTYDWDAVDYGDYYNFTWRNEHIYG